MDYKESSCPLCNSTETSLFSFNQLREYFRCQNCRIIFVPGEYFLSREEERKRYDLHQNSPDDNRYRNFLHPLFQAVKINIKEGARGLDFGCGPGPTLSLMLEESGFFLNLYDSFYQPDTSVFEEKYDFITASEVVEHLHSPLKEFKQLWSCLNKGGIIGIMTQLLTKDMNFQKWHYIKDDTHVCFFSLPTFHWLAAHLKARLESPAKNVILLFKT
jgi:SAM-dependent methyltransferase